MPRCRRTPVRCLTAIDLFAGAGGASVGLRSAGFEIVAAVEADEDAASTYQRNHPGTLMCLGDIRQFDPVTVGELSGLAPGKLTLLKACPPCQGFSTLGTGDTDDPRNDLVREVWRFASSLRPRSIVVENVPGLRSDARLIKLVRQLRAVGYAVREYVEDAVHFGVPQHRRRLIIVAVHGISPDDLPASLSAPRPRRVRTVAEAFAGLPRGGDDLSRHRTLAPTTLQRVRAIPPGGTRFDLPVAHQLACHKKLKSRTATAAYGRLRPHEPAPTMTTRCTTPACGRFIHPTENRGLTLREAALLQSFPRRYRFAGDYGSVERQIGNALPPPIATAVGRIVTRLLGYPVR